MNPEPHIHTQSELAALSLDAASAALFSPLSGQGFLIFVSGAKAPSGQVARRVREWLHQLPCPTIGIFGPGADSALRKACDVVLPDLQSLKALAHNLEQRPRAATVFVQLLRVSESLGVSDALTAESLAYATLQSGPEYRDWLASAKPDPVTLTDKGLPVIVERDDAVLILELNRASNRNAISVEVRDALAEALQLVLSDPSIKQLVIKGRGRCFSIGGDLSEFGTVPDPVAGHLVRNLALPGRLLSLCAERAEVRVHGACIGAGIEFPAFARRIVAAPDAFFQLPELKFGLIPGAGGCVSIARRIGRQRLAEWVLSGRRVKAPEALEWGLIDAIG